MANVSDIRFHIKSVKQTRQITNAMHMVSAARMRRALDGIAKNLDLEFGVKNVFGKTLRTLYFPLNPHDTCDVPYMGQTFWINLLYKF